MTGLKDYAQKVASFPGCTTVLGMKLASGMYNRYLNNSKRMSCMCLALLKQKAGVTNINEV